jgi:hypothetical protein
MEWAAAEGVLDLVKVLSPKRDVTVKQLRMAVELAKEQVLFKLQDFLDDHCGDTT